MSSSRTSRRTSLLVHVLDLAPELSAGEGADVVVDNHATIERELFAHDERLARLPRLLVLSKSDLVTPERTDRLLEEWRRPTRTGDTRDRDLERPPARAFGSSRASCCAEGGNGGRRRPNGGRKPRNPRRTGSPSTWSSGRPPGPASRSNASAQDRSPVRGTGIERLLQRYDVENADAMAYLEGRLRRLGRSGRALEGRGLPVGRRDRDRRSGVRARPQLSRDHPIALARRAGARAAAGGSPAAK